MERHTYFDLLLHSDDELTEAVGTPIARRETLHEWPLSCVQRLHLADGGRIIYKAQSGPTVEAEFYAAARSNLLIPARTIYRDERYACMLFDYVDAPLLEETTITRGDESYQERKYTADNAAPELNPLVICKQIIGEINQIEGDYPVYFDVSTWDKWQGQMDGLLQDLHGQVSFGRYKRVTKMHLNMIGRWAASREVKEAFEDDIGLVHTDLSGDNIFILSEKGGGPSYRVIDWQRPILGPRGVDTVLLLSSLEIDPRPYASLGANLITSLLRIHWLTECSLVWFPEALSTYDQWTASLAETLGNFQPGGLE
jgi:hypothetical protein